MEESFHNLAKADIECPIPKRERGISMCGLALASVGSPSGVKGVALHGSNWCMVSIFRGGEMWRSSTQRGGSA